MDVCKRKHGDFRAVEAAGYSTIAQAFHGGNKRSTRYLVQGAHHRISGSRGTVLATAAESKHPLLLPVNDVCTWSRETRGQIQDLLKRVIPFSLRKRRRARWDYQDCPDHGSPQMESQ